MVMQQPSYVRDQRVIPMVGMVVSSLVMLATPLWIGWRRRVYESEQMWAGDGSAVTGVDAGTSLGVGDGLVFVLTGFGPGVVALVVLVLSVRSWIAQRGPRVVIDGRGVLDRSIADFVIPWSAIREAQLLTFEEQPFIYLWLHRPEEIYARLTPMKRMMQEGNREFGYGDLVIAMFQTDREAKEVLAEIEGYLEIKD